MLVFWQPGRSCRPSGPNNLTDNLADNLTDILRTPSIHSIKPKRHSQSLCGRRGDSDGHSAFRVGLWNLSQSICVQCDLFPTWINSNSLSLACESSSLSFLRESSSLSFLRESSSLSLLRESSSLSWERVPLSLSWESLKGTQSPSAIQYCSLGSRRRRDILTTYGRPPSPCHHQRTAPSRLALLSLKKARGGKI